MWLICAATSGELGTWASDLFPDCDLIVSGVGIPATFATLLPWLQTHPYSRIVNIGIAGAYPGSGLQIGDIVVAAGDSYADLGMELPGESCFQLLTDTPFGGDYRSRYPQDCPVELHVAGTAIAFGATVNACTGTEKTGVARRERTGAGFETMEGAAVAQIGFLKSVPVTQIRAISNIAADRDMRPENIGLALRHLADYLNRCKRPVT